MTKVVHIVTKLELGGAQLNTIYTYENLNKSRFDAYLLSGPGGILQDKISQKNNLKIIKDLVRQINPWKDLKALFQIIRELRRLKPDVVHTHSSKAGILGRFAAFCLRTPLVIHSVHGFSFSPYQSYLKRLLFLLIEKIGSRITDCLIFVSLGDISIAEKHRLIKRGHTLIRSGFPLAKFLPNQNNLSPIREKYNLDKEDFVVGIIAPFKPQKGLFHLVEIAEKVIPEYKNTIFFIAGDGELREELENKLKDKEILDHFRLPGFLYDIEKIMDIFDIGVSTALWEGLPQSLVQLRLKKKAIVASDIPGNREVIKENASGFLVNALDYREFAKKVLALIKNKPMRERLAQFEDDFSQWDAEHMVRQQELLYSEMLSEKRSGYKVADQ